MPPFFLFVFGRGEEGSVAAARERTRKERHAPPQRTEALSYSDSHCKNGCLLWVVGAAVVGRAVVVEGQQLGCMLLPGFERARATHCFS